MILPNLASFCNRAGGLSEDAYNKEEDEHAQQKEEEEMNERLKKFDKELKDRTEADYQKTKDKMNNQTDKLINDIKLSSEASKKTEILKEEVEKAKEIMALGMSDVDANFNKIFPYRTKKFTDMDYRDKLNKAIVTYGNLVEGLASSDLLMGIDDHYYKIVCDANVRVVKFAYEQWDDLEEMRKYYKNKISVLDKNGETIDNVIDKLNLINPLIRGDVANKSGFDEYYKKSMAEVEEYKKQLAAIENLLEQHGKTREKMLSLEERYHKNPYNTTIINEDENKNEDKKPSEIVNKVVELKDDVENKNKEKIDVEKKEKWEKYDREQKFNAKVYSDASKLVYENKLNKYYDKLVKRKKEQRDLWYVTIGPWFKNIMEKNCEEYEEDLLDIRTNNFFNEDIAKGNYSIKDTVGLISKCYLKTKCHYEILKIQVDYIEKNKEFSEFLEEYTNNMKFLKTGLERLKKVQNGIIEFLNSKGRDLSYFEFDSRVLLDVDADID